MSPDHLANLYSSKAKTNKVIITAHYFDTKNPTTTDIAIDQF
ncbi:hypothetical protein [Pseudoalteromonas tunicata]|uniref:Uncharacterized protein n=1 Tax=Pseudoalteromonas tunicata D2 TaxID=87626 RepID=A4CA41_9GAMM|nr:hypothetical protein [Pseudoalteromonas tunicata]ATC94798.1 hypothetical protein PTUN_a2293 [Pseudoalteromonas tunicata]EAR28249.1 hypothetical protein PTD2_20577 [Pseudoalteromonas tunicata D2]MDP5213456.1 hypothetical protein [Pseudoalteromonas tunicata]